MDKKKRQYINDLLNKYFKWLVVVIVILMLVGGYFWVIKPKYQQTLDSIKTELKLKKQSYLSKKEKMKKVNKLASVYNDMGHQKIERINTFLPTGRDYEQLFTEMDSLVSQNGMILNMMSISAGGEKSRQDQTGQQGENSLQRDLPSEVKTVKMNLEVTGTDYSGLKSLISSMENNLRLMDVVEVNFSPNKKTVQLVVWTYYFNPKEFDVVRDINL